MSLLNTCYVMQFLEMSDRLRKEHSLTLRDNLVWSLVLCVLFWNGWFINALIEKLLLNNWCQWGWWQAGEVINLDQWFTYFLWLIWSWCTGLKDGSQFQFPSTVLTFKSVCSWMLTFRLLYLSMLWQANERSWLQLLIILVHLQVALGIV